MNNSNGFMNRMFRVIWNASMGVWQAVSEASKGRGKTKSVKGAPLLLLCAAGLGQSALAGDLPTGGQVVGGTGSIAQSGSTMTVQQGSDRLAVDWASFSVGQGNTVNFVQPSATSVAFNRVLGTDVSVIQGAIRANGQVFLQNPNGITFTPTAQIDVGSLVASTLSLRVADFMAGNYTFEGSSSNAILNQGHITAAHGGTVALIAAKINNEGSLTAGGGNVLLGAGSKVTLDMGGPVKLQIENTALETLIHNGGAIKADGGVIWLTSQAASNLASSVISNIGVIEAQTLATGESGEIILFAHDGTVNVGGRLDASAALSGNGGFIETSGSRVDLLAGRTVTTLATAGQTGTWLIDPNDYTIAPSGGNITGAQLSTDLNSTNVTISTAVSGTSGGNGDIFVNDAVSWSTNQLKLVAERNINVNATLDASGSASLAFEYGQGSAGGVGSAYTVANAAKIYIPQATAFTWKKGAAGATNNLIFDNGNIRFGDGSQAALNSEGLLEQPWYFDNTSVVSGTTRNAWYRLTFANYALNMEVGAGGDGSTSWNRNGDLLDSQNNLGAAVTNRRFDISGYREGTGSIVSSLTLGFAGGESVKVDNTYTLASGASYVKIDTNLTNVGSSAANNLRLWVGTQDDYVATRDSQYKYKGNLTSNGFEQITVQTEQSKALKITEFDTGEGAAILFYSTSSGADTSIAQCCSFTNATGIDPRTSPISRGPEDGSYALFIRLQDLTAGQTDGMTWYYAAAPAAQLDSVVNTVAESAGVSPPPPSQAPAVPRDTTVPQTTAVSTAQGNPAGSLTNTMLMPAQLSPTGPPPTSVVTEQGSLPVFDVSGGLAFVQVAAPSAGSAATLSESGAGTTGGAEVASQQSGQDPLGFMRVFVVGGGVNTADVSDVVTNENLRRNVPQQ